MTDGELPELTDADFHYVNLQRETCGLPPVRRKWARRILYKGDWWRQEPQQAPSNPPGIR